ncbi:STAS domain-containing protein [Micromonospora terminaliae]|uniref:STAS domain-containing protein n=1 Tax=Micromonospora terminaliae TaxID=1914461 RepID=A0AAJ2ZD00_9ACTN|nr:STAS domain-containing protein [Micromonospora terminaliae]NES27523.1 STAS domain-containing protein [Micromonospora terminaliae]QGL47744.1 STAS domain-containing protein [Micromonospora terminaliae]
MSVDQAQHPSARETVRPPALSLALAREGPAVVVEVGGAVDLSTVDPLVALVNRLLSGQPPPVLVLDLSRVSFFCAAGVNALLTVRRRAGSAGCALVLRRPSRITVTVLDIVGLTDEFTTE